MQFTYETIKRDFSDFSSGRVLYNAPGSTGFPIRLTSEIFQISRSYLQKPSQLNVYDPCCGGAHLLTGIGFLHGGSIQTLYGSDSNETIIETGQSNLRLLTYEGLAQRKRKLEKDYLLFNKSAHAEALKSVDRLKSYLDKTGEVKGEIFQFNIASKDVPKLEEIHIVMTDLPYGELVSWDTNVLSPVKQMLQNVYSVLAHDGVVAVVRDKFTLIEHPLFRRLKVLKHGKRKVTLLQAIDHEGVQN